MHFSKFALPLALAGSALANPLEKRGCDDSCCAAVTGQAAVIDPWIRSSDCASYLVTTVTPSAVVVTATITGYATATSALWKRDVLWCPNSVPVYASACSATGEYASACACWGFTSSSTTTLPPATYTQTVYVNPTCAPPTTVTVTAGAPTSTPSFCLTDADAEYITDSFANFLMYTKTDFNTTLAETVLADNFTDTSDSINFLAQKPLTTVTFPSKAAFIGGQGNQPAIPSVVTLNIWHDCDTITWRWRAFFGPTAAPVTGINAMITTETGGQVQLLTNYAEFDNGAWLLNLGNPQCKTNTTNSTSSPAARRAVNLWK